MPPVLTKIGAGATIIDRVRDGLIVEEMIDGDALGVFRQLSLELRPRAAAR